MMGVRAGRPKGYDTLDYNWELANAEAAAQGGPDKGLVFPRTVTVSRVDEVAFALDIGIEYCKRCGLITGPAKHVATKTDWGNSYSGDT